MDISAVSAPSPALQLQPSVWYVTNGRQVVGPVDTALLLRGIAQGRVPEDSFVAQSTWALWRPLNQIREVRALYREQEMGRPLTDALPFAGIDDNDKLLKQALKLAVEHTHADVGLVHQDWAPHVGLITTHAYGRGMKPALGRVLPWYDPSRDVAADGKVLLSAANKADWTKAAARRMANGGPVKAVALVPVHVNKGHRTVIELGHFFHSFRSQDTEALEQLSVAVSLRLEQLAF